MLRKDKAKKKLDKLIEIKLKNFEKSQKMRHLKKVRDLKNTKTNTNTPDFTYQSDEPNTQRIRTKPHENSTFFHIDLKRSRKDL